MILSSHIPFSDEDNWKVELFFKELRPIVDVDPGQLQIIARVLDNRQNNFQNAEPRVRSADQWGGEVHHCGIDLSRLIFADCDLHLVFGV